MSGSLVCDQDIAKPMLSAVTHSNQRNSSSSSTVVAAAAVILLPTTNNYCSLLLILISLVLLLLLLLKRAHMHTRHTSTRKNVLCFCSSPFFLQKEIEEKYQEKRVLLLQLGPYRRRKVAATGMDCHFCGEVGE
jgi:hypothetical protein